MFRRSLSSRVRPRRWKVVQAYQRARYGYSDVDLWNLDSHLAAILASACPRLLTADEEWNGDMERMGELFAGYEGWSLDTDAQERNGEAVRLLGKNFGGLWN